MVHITSRSNRIAIILAIAMIVGSICYNVHEPVYRPKQNAATHQIVETVWIPRGGRLTSITRTLSISDITIHTENTSSEFDNALESAYAYESISDYDLINNEDSSKDSNVDQHDYEEPVTYNVYDEAESPSSSVDLTESEIRDFAALVYLESGGESYECQLAVASVILNRMVSTGSTLHEVIYAPNQFTPASRVHCTEPSNESLEAVNEVVNNGPSIPDSVTFFRTGHYHNWSSLIQPYTVIDGVYFSYDVRI